MWKDSLLFWHDYQRFDSFFRIVSQRAGVFLLKQFLKRNFLWAFHSGKRKISLKAFFLIQEMSYEGKSFLGDVLFLLQLCRKRCVSSVFYQPLIKCEIISSVKEKLFQLRYLYWSFLLSKVFLFIKKINKEMRYQQQTETAMSTSLGLLYLLCNLESVSKKSF